MSSPAFTAVSVAVVLGLVGVLGCSTGPSVAEKIGAGESDENALRPELRTTSTRYLGQIASGETKSYPYFNPPPYRSVGFTAKGGDQITVDVKSTDGGDALAWITTPACDILAANDDASSDTRDAQVVYTVPGGAPSRPYHIVFRDKNLASVTFAVTLTVVTPPPVTCSYNGQTYPTGVTFPALDDCNTCSCTSTGDVSCTTLPCPCDPENEPWRNYQGRSPAECGTIVFLPCTPDWRIFQNTCGCGCELIVH